MTATRCHNWRAIAGAKIGFRDERIGFGSEGQTGRVEIVPTENGNSLALGFNRVTILVQIRAFGYLPLDSTVVAEQDTSLTFELEINSLAKRLIDDRQTCNGLRERALILPEDLERIEVLERGAMLRIHTREFIKKMLGGAIELPRPLYIPDARPPMCRSTARCTWRWDAQGTVPASSVDSRALWESG